MEVMMREAGSMMHGIGLHYYTVDWNNKGSATQFGDAGWFKVLKKTLFMEELIARHSTLMDRYDPQKKVSLGVDEWGTWYDVEPGTNPGFLYQQNSLRDALVAGINLNLFNNHADRVRLGNIAQVINVLQSVILTRESRMVLTPTYHVFDLYKVHQDATLLPATLMASDYQYSGDKIPALNVSASRDSAGKIHVTLCNLDPHQPQTLTAELRGAKVSRVSGQILTASEINAHNNFEQPERVKPALYTSARITSSGFTAEIPSKSVLVLELE
jgi:alpha-N-arabinofuranosidase